MTQCDETCGPCHAGGAPLSGREAGELAGSLPQWTVSEKHLEREFILGDFLQAMAFVNQVADAANEADHHPDIYISYSRVRLTLTTRKIGGLSQNDFTLAAQIDQLAEAVAEGVRDQDGDGVSGERPMAQAP